MDTTRRNLLGLAGLAPFMTLAACVQRAEAEGYRFGETAEDAYNISVKAHEELMAYPDINMHGAEQIAMICYDRMTMLDLVGPQYFLSSMMGSTVHLVSPNPDLAPIMGDTGFAIVPTTSMDDCPKDLDILFVPGGTSGTVAVMEDDSFLDFIADRGSRAKHVTSVCTGSMILGQAGLLRGKRATSHWATHHLLSEFGAIPVNERVVQDGNVTTGAGVSAGLDFALALLAQIRGEKYAKGIQLQAEYQPEPIFNAGSPDTADPEFGETLHEMFAPALFAMKEAASKQRS
ncbi:MAG: DJ-1/PfpI family protein [Pseudomonadota bacterium]